MAHAKHLFGRLAPTVCFSRRIIAGTLVFAVEGAMAAVDGNLDLIGIMVLAFCHGAGRRSPSGISCSALFPLPPLRDWRYPPYPSLRRCWFSFCIAMCGRSLRGHPGPGRRRSGAICHGGHVESDAAQDGLPWSRSCWAQSPASGEAPSATFV